MILLDYSSREERGWCLLFLPSGPVNSLGRSQCVDLQRSCVYRPVRSSYPTKGDLGDGKREQGEDRDGKCTFTKVHTDPTEVDSSVLSTVEKDHSKVSLC